MNTVTVGETTYSVPFADLLPPLADDERDALEADIRERGVIVPIIVTEEHEVLDGSHRLSIACALGLADVPVVVVTGLSAEEKRARAEDLNLHRRHLTREQRQAIIARRLKADPAQSNNAIATAVSADDKTVAAVRRRLEATSEIPRLARTRGRDGRTRPARAAIHRARATAPKEPSSVAQPGAATETPPAPTPTARLSIGRQWGELRTRLESVELKAKRLIRLTKKKPAERDLDLVWRELKILQRDVDDVRQAATELGPPGPPSQRAEVTTKTAG